MKNFIQPGDSLDMIAPATLASGDGVLIGALFGVAASAAASGARVAIATKGVFEMPKASAENIAAGAILHWDDSAKELTLDSDTGGNPKVGVAVQASAGGAPTVRIRLNGAF